MVRELTFLCFTRSVCRLETMVAMKFASFLPTSLTGIPTVIFNGSKIYRSQRTFIFSAMGSSGSLSALKSGPGMRALRATGGGTTAMITLSVSNLRDWKAKFLRKRNTRASQYCVLRLDNTCPISTLSGMNTLLLGARPIRALGLIGHASPKCWHGTLRCFRKLYYKNMQCGILMGEWRGWPCTGCMANEYFRRPSLSL